MALLRLVQNLSSQFWKKWTKQYLPELQRRQKWNVEQTNLKPGDLVLIMDENSTCGLWPMDIVEKVNTGRDGLVRSAQIRTRLTKLVRPIMKLVFLESTICD